MSIISYFIFNITNNHTKQTQQFSFQSNQITAHQYTTNKEKITCSNCQALGISNLEAEKICHNQKGKFFFLNLSQHIHMKIHVQNKEKGYIVDLFGRIDEKNTNISPIILFNFKKN